MLKGHVFSQQVFGVQVFAAFVDTFLNEECGIKNGYGNSMSVSCSGSTVTVQSGIACIRGRFAEEDSSTDISAGTENMYCKLVIEVDLDKTNTDTTLNQASYKIVKSSSTYPELTQTDIVNNVSGIYQFELARFKTTSSGITDFEDTRTFLDFESIYAKVENKLQETLDTNQEEYLTMLEKLKEELASVEDGTAYVLKDNFAIIDGKMTLEANTSENVNNDTEKQTILDIDFPENFTKDNCVCLAFRFSTIRQ